MFCPKDLKHYKFKQAFSLVELVVSISIFGIIAAGVFRSTLLNYETLNLSLQNEKNQTINQALEVLLTYLDDAIKQSIHVQNNQLYWARKNTIAMQHYFASINLDEIKNHELPTTLNAKMLNQIFKDSDEIDFQKEFKIAIIFDAINYKAADFGYFTKPNLALVKATSDDKLILKNDFMGHISQNYRLISSAYALMLEKDQIWLISSWQPWANEPIKNARKTLLLDGVKSLKIAHEKDGLKIEICLNDQSSTCKERLFF